MNINTENTLNSFPSAMYIYNMVRNIYASRRNTFSARKKKRALQKILMIKDSQFWHKPTFMNIFLSELVEVCKGNKGIVLSKCRREGEEFVLDEEGPFECVSFVEFGMSTQESLNTLRDLLIKTVNKYKFY